MEAHDDDAPLAPERMMALIEAQQRTVAARTAAFVPWILAAWGIAWLAGFLVLWADAETHPHEWRPSLTAGLIFAGLLVVAGVLSSVLGARSGRGLRGTREASIVGIAYGNTWWIGSVALVGMGQSLLRFGMPEELLTVFYPSAFIFFSGIMYMMGGLIWQARPMMVLGIWCVILSALGAMLVPPMNYVAYGLAGGGAFLLVAGWSAWWVRSSRRRLSSAG
ncbi:hypothetical protein [Microbacterium sp. NPDC058345]|uniref:hypothetical protein n=1 Tax=Microbacterium sp. NPDC058345 TaxID=3346455 RepID=UPI00365C2965